MYRRKVRMSSEGGGQRAVCKCGYVHQVGASVDPSTSTSSGMDHDVERAIARAERAERALEALQLKYAAAERDLIQSQGIESHANELEDSNLELRSRIGHLEDKTEELMAQLEQERKDHNFQQQRMSKELHETKEELLFKERVLSTMMGERTSLSIPPTPRSPDDSSHEVISSDGGTTPAIRHRTDAKAEPSPTATNNHLDGGNGASRSPSAAQPTINILGTGSDEFKVVEEDGYDLASTTTPSLLSCPSPAESDERHAGSIGSETRRKLKEGRAKRKDSSVYLQELRGDRDLRGPHGSAQNVRYPEEYVPAILKEEEQELKRKRSIRALTKRSLSSGRLSRRDSGVSTGTARTAEPKSPVKGKRAASPPAVKHIVGALAAHSRKRGAADSRSVKSPGPITPLSSNPNSRATTPDSKTKHRTPNRTPDWSHVQSRYMAGSTTPRSISRGRKATSTSAAASRDTSVDSVGSRSSNRSVEDEISDVKNERNSLRDRTKELRRRLEAW